LRRYERLNVKLLMPEQKAKYPKREPRYLQEEETQYLREEDTRYIEGLLESPVESKYAEYKAAKKFNEGTEFAAKLVKHILGFANSGGGHLIIGYKEQPDGSLAPDPQMTEEIASSYEVTRLCQYVERFLGEQDRIKIKIYKKDFGGTVYPIIYIGRFRQYPCVCTKDYIHTSTQASILKRGQTYIRTEGARTLIVEAPSEWRQLIREVIKAGKEAGML
jgi:predicted HTH transcriptional regulator